MNDEPTLHDPDPDDPEDDDDNLPDEPTLSFAQNGWLYGLSFAVMLCAVGGAALRALSGQLLAGPLIVVAAVLIQAIRIVPKWWRFHQSRTLPGVRYRANIASPVHPILFTGLAGGLTLWLIADAMNDQVTEGLALYITAIWLRVGQLWLGYAFYRHAARYPG